MSHPHPTRRLFLRRSAVALGGLCAASALPGPLAELAHARRPRGLDYGPLAAVADANTGLPLLELPAGFTYTTFGWAGDPLPGGATTPPAQDGMGVVRARSNRLWLVRNHELPFPGASFGPPALTWDPQATGGTTVLEFDPGRGRFLGARVGLAGTRQNCAGGVTPWGSWLTCEENVDPLAESHGWVFEVPAIGDARPEPLRALGRFVHEAATVDPTTGIVYETEDRGTAGFYRLLPNVRGQLARGGRLQMLAVAGTPQADLRGAVGAGVRFPVAWVDVDDPERAHSPGTSDTLGVFSQGFAAGGAVFRRLEGCGWGNREVFFTSTSGGAAGRGQLWAYSPRWEQLRCVYESPSADVMNNPDNLAFSPQGNLLLCEDGSRVGQYLLGVTQRGEVFPFARNAVVLDGQVNGWRGDFRGSEWAGATFWRRWLFVNVFLPGFTAAITGPWERGAL